MEGDHIGHMSIEMHTHIALILSHVSSSGRSAVGHSVFLTFGCICQRSICSYNMTPGLPQSLLGLVFSFSLQ